MNIIGPEMHKINIKCYLTALKKHVSLPAIGTFGSMALGGQFFSLRTKAPERPAKGQKKKWEKKEKKKLSKTILPIQVHINILFFSLKNLKTFVLCKCSKQNVEIIALEL